MSYIFLNYFIDGVYYPEHVPQQYSISTGVSDTCVSLKKLFLFIQILVQSEYVFPKYIHVVIDVSVYHKWSTNIWPQLGWKLSPPP